MFLGINLMQMLATGGYWVVFFAVAVESAGVPVPGEAMLLTAAVFAGINGHLAIAGVIAAAAAGAILGDNAGYLVGRTIGERILRRFDRAGGRSRRALVMGRYLFERQGGKAVFFGRFVAVLRILAGPLAGATHMSWPRFAVYNATGSVLWAGVMGVLGYSLGASVTGPLGIAGLVGAALVALAGALALRRHGRCWERQAVQALVAGEEQEAA